MVASVLGSSVPERHGHTGTSSEKGHKDDQGSGTSDVRGEGERAGTLKCAEEKAQGGLNHLYKYLMGESKEGKDRFFPVVPSDRKKGNGHKLKQRRMVKHKTKFF